LGWSLDDSTEHFTMEDALKHFSLERVNKAPASFDPQKLLAFQARWMSQLELKKKVAMVVPFLQRAGWIGNPPPCSTSDYVASVVTAAGDRIKVAGDILQFDELFCPDEQLAIDPDLVAKRIKNEPAAIDALRAIRTMIETSQVLDQATLEPLIKTYAAEQGIKLGVCINALRVALTGKGTGLGVFDYVVLLGRDRCLSRIDRVAMLDS
jgi:glutamyl-tRNA synthetase